MESPRLLNELSSFTVVIVIRTPYSICLLLEDYWAIRSSYHYLEVGTCPYVGTIQNNNNNMMLYYIYYIYIYIYVLYIYIYEDLHLHMFMCKKAIGNSWLPANCYYRG